MQLKTDSVVNFFRQGHGIMLGSSFIGQFRQIVCLKLDAVQLIIATQFLNLFLSLFLGQLILTILITGKLIEELLLREFLSPLLFCSKFLRNREEWHDRVMVKTINIHLVQYLQRIGKRLRNIRKDGVHLLLGLKPLLLGIQHTSRIVQVLACRQTKQMVMSLRVFLVHEMGIIGTDQFNTVFPCQFYENLIGFLLQREGLPIGTDSRVGHLMALEFQVIILSKQVMIPFYSLTGSSDITLQDFGRYLTGNTCRADNQSFMVFLQVGTIRTGTHIIAVYP